MKTATSNTGPALSILCDVPLVLRDAVVEFLDRIAPGMQTVDDEELQSEFCIPNFRLFDTHQTRQDGERLVPVQMRLVVTSETYTERCHRCA